MEEINQQNISQKLLISESKDTPQPLSRRESRRLRLEGIEKRRIARQIRGERRLAHKRAEQEFQDLVKKATAEGKPIPVRMRSSGCGGCRKAKKNLEILKQQATK